MGSASDGFDYAAWLERSGWHREIAGDGDFATAVSAISEMYRTRNRGLCLLGAVGVGKTSLAEAVMRGLAGRRARIDCSDNGEVDLLVPQCDAGANGGVYSSGCDEYLAMSVLVDDLGREAIRQTYGNVLDRVGNFIVRYHLRGTGRLVITTNLSASEIERRYSSRVLDRIFEKCVVARLAGKSKRNRTIIGARE